MNPLDKEEFTTFLQTIKKDMPIHTDSIAKIKCSFSQGMPKNLMVYSRKVDNEFLNSNLAIIEEISHIDSKHWIPKWFQQYQNKIYGDAEILNHDNFFKATLHDIWRDCYEKDIPFPKLSGGMRSMSIQNAGFLGSLTNEVNGATLETLGTNDVAANTADEITASKLATATVGHYYDQVAHNIAIASGNYNQGVYDTSGGVPTNLIQSTGSIAVTADFALKSLTEFQINTTQMWTASMTNNATTQWRTWNGASGDAYTKTGTFPTLNNPLSGTIISTQRHSKIAHS